jgi:hypothetical protein
MTGSVPLDCVMLGGGLSALGSCTQNAVSGFVRLREGFRMPARRERSTQHRGPASESLRRTNARESGGRLAVYGDLAGFGEGWFFEDR